MMGLKQRWDGLVGLLLWAVIMTACAGPDPKASLPSDTRAANELVNRASASAREVQLCQQKVAAMVTVVETSNSLQEIRLQLLETRRRLEGCLAGFSSSRELIKQALALPLPPQDTQYLRIVEAAIADGYDAVSFAHGDVWYLLQDWTIFIKMVLDLGPWTSVFSAVTAQVEHGNFGEARSDLAELKNKVGHLRVRGESLAKREPALQGLSVQYQTLDSMIVNLDALLVALQQEDLDTATRIQSEIEEAVATLSAQGNPTIRSQEFEILRKLESRFQQYNAQVRKADEYAAASKLTLDPVALPIID